MKSNKRNVQQEFHEVMYNSFYKYNEKSNSNINISRKEKFKYLFLREYTIVACNLFHEVTEVLLPLLDHVRCSIEISLSK